MPEAITRFAALYMSMKVPAIDVGPIFGNASRRVNEDLSKAIITSTLRRLAGTGRKTLEVKIWGYGELRPHVIALRASIPTQLVAAFGGRNHEKHRLDRRPVRDGQVHLAT
jgi:hypothetical protein